MRLGETSAWGARARVSFSSSSTIHGLVDRRGDIRCLSGAEDQPIIGVIGRSRRSMPRYTRSFDNKFSNQFWLPRSRDRSLHFVHYLSNSISWRFSYLFNDSSEIIHLFVDFLLFIRSIFGEFCIYLLILCRLFIYLFVRTIIHLFNNFLLFIHSSFGDYYIYLLVL